MNPDIEPGDYNRNPVSPQPKTVTIPDEMAGSRIDQALAQLFPDYSRSRLQGGIKEGLVLLNGSVPETKAKVWGGETVELSPQAQPEELAFVPQDIPLNVVYEDDTLLVINKPPGLVVHPGSGNWDGTLLNALLAHDPALAKIPRAGIVHRLDKDTSGLLVVAKTLPAQLDLVRQLQERSVKREYFALAQGLVKQDGTVDAPIGRHPRDRLKMAVVGTGKPAITHYRVRERFRFHTLLQCKLETGRTHQIRVHMAHINHPLAGDQVYNGKPRLLPEALRDALEEFNRQALHAARLALVHPGTGKSMLWKAPLPDDMNYLLECMRADIEGTDMPDDLDDDDWNEDDYDVEVIYHP